MFFFGLLSLLQIWFVPGFLLISFSKKFNIYDKLILAVPLSIVLNYIIVFFLIFFKIYNFYAILFIIFFEISALIFIYKYNLKLSNNLKLKINFNKNFYFIDLLLLFLFLSYLGLAFMNVGEITYPGDPLVMWDTWAKTFAKGIIPENTMDYPQAYPILMSITYILIGSIDIEFFSRSVGLAYPIMIWIMFFRIQKLLPKFENEIKLTLFFTTLFTLNQFRHTLFIGYVDPILVFSSVTLGYIMVINIIHKFRDEDIFIICLIAILPGLLKQTSLYLSLVFPILFYLINFNFVLKKNYYLKTFCIYILIFLLFLVPWYAYKIYLFQLNQETFQMFSLSFFSNTNQLVNNQFSELYKSVVLNLNYGLKLVFGKFGLLVMFLFIIGYFKNYYSKIISLIVLPYFLLWANIFANDARNFAFMLPLIAFVLSCALLSIFNFFDNSFSKFFKTDSNKFLLINNFLLIGFIFFSVYFINEKRNANVLYEKQYKKELKRTNYPDVNLLLYNYFKNKDIGSTKIIMYDFDFNKLPNFERSSNLSCQDSALEYLEKYSDQKFYYLIKRDTCSKNFMKYFNGLVNKKIIFKHENHIFWKNK